MFVRKFYILRTPPWDIPKPVLRMNAIFFCVIKLDIEVGTPRYSLTYTRTNNISMCKSIWRQIPAPWNENRIVIEILHRYRNWYPVQVEAMVCFITLTIIYVTFKADNFLSSRVRIFEYDFEAVDTLLGKSYLSSILHGCNFHSVQITVLRTGYQRVTGGWQNIFEDALLHAIDRYLFQTAVLSLFVELM